MVKGPKYRSSYHPGPNEQVDMTELVRARVKNRRDEVHRLRTFGFNGANTTRLNSDWLKSPQSADSELRYALRNLRFRCRELERNNDWFRKLLSLFEDNVVSSTGIAIQMKIYDMVKDPETKEMVRQLDSRSCELIEAAWKEQCEPANYTVTRVDSAIATDKLNIRSIVRDGDIMNRKVRGYKNRYNYAIQLLEADYLDDFYSDSRTLANGNQVRMGVELDDWKCPQAYWILTQHPGDFAYGLEIQGKRDRLKADTIIHPFVRERPEQSRGYPWAVAAMNRFNMLGAYEEAELVAARLAACKGGFYETDRPQAGDIGGGYAGELDAQRIPMETMEPGVNETLPIGMKFKPNDPQHPNANFPAFSKQQLRAAASSCGVSYISLANDLEGVNYSSIRAGLLDERETYKGVQTFYVDTAKNPVFEDWLEWVLLGGYLGITLKAKDFKRLNQKQYKCRRWDWVDPLKDINAAVTAIEAGLDTRSNIIANKGGDFEDVMNELHYEEGVINTLQLNFGAAQPSTQKPNFPDADEQDPDAKALKETKELQALLEVRKQTFGLDAKMEELDKRMRGVVVALETRLATFATSEQVLALADRHNPNHAEQPRHEESGQWIETEKKIESVEVKVDKLLEVVQMLMGKKSAEDLPIIIERKPEEIRGIAGPMGRSNGVRRGCVMVNLSPVEAGPILRYAESIKKEDIDPAEGIEMEPHITALYGFTNDDPTPVITICKEFGPITATLGPIEVFANPEYDVLKVAVISPDLVRLNTALKTLPFENDHPDYHPHLTIAYLKPGSSKDYIGSDAFKGVSLVFHSIEFSDSEKKKTNISLNKPEADRSLAGVPPIPIGGI